MTDTPSTFTGKEDLGSDRYGGATESGRQGAPSPTKTGLLARLRSYGIGRRAFGKKLSEVVPGSIPAQRAIQEGDDVLEAVKLLRLFGRMSREAMAAAVHPEAFKTLRDFVADAGFDADELPDGVIVKEPLDEPLANRAGEREEALAKAEAIRSLLNDGAARVHSGSQPSNGMNQNLPSSTPPGAGSREGFVLVPCEPTEAMHATLTELGRALFSDPHERDQMTWFAVKAWRAICALFPPAGASQGQEVPEGWKLVPLEPTDAMRAAGFQEWNRLRAAGTTLLYRAMLAASPSPPSGKEER